MPVTCIYIVVVIYEYQFAGCFYRRCLVVIYGVLWSLTELIAHIMFRFQSQEPKNPNCHCQNQHFCPCESMLHSQESISWNNLESCIPHLSYMSVDTIFVLCSE